MVTGAKVILSVEVSFGTDYNYESLAVLLNSVPEFEACPQNLCNSILHKCSLFLAIDAL
jgi:hypothetical protein